MAYVYLVLSSKVKARSVIAGNSAPAVHAQKVSKDTFNDLIRGNLSIDTKKYQGVLEYALSKVDFSVVVSIYMLPSNLNLNIGKKRRIQQQYSSKQQRHKNWLKQGYKQGS